LIDILSIAFLACLAVLREAQHCSEASRRRRVRTRGTQILLCTTQFPVLRMFDPNALDADFGRPTATLVVASAKDGVIAMAASR